LTVTIELQLSAWFHWRYVNQLQMSVLTVEPLLTEWELAAGKSGVIIITASGKRAVSFQLYTSISM